jgi:hypothetical protein
MFFFLWQINIGSEWSQQNKQIQLEIKQRKKYILARCLTLR